MWDYDIILQGMGGIGKSQIIIAFMLSYFMIFGGINALATVFIAYLPDYRCNVSPLSAPESDLLNYTTPYDGSAYDGCKRYGYNLSTCNSSLDCVDVSAEPISCDNGYVYDRSLFTETVITEFDLVCDQYYLIALSTSMYQVGILVGSILFGNAADRFGRKPTSIVTFIGTLGCSFAIGYSTNVAMYMIFRTLAAAFSYGTVLGTFVYVMELTSVKWRTVFGIGYQIFFPIGYIIQSLIAYYWRDWHDIMLICNIVSSPFLLFALILPESPRWLFTTNRSKQGKKVVEKMVRFNGKTLKDDIWDKAEIAEDEKSTLKADEVEVKYSTVDLFRHKGTRMVTLNVMFNWFVNTLVYYGVSLNAGSLAGDLFLNNTLNGVMEMASYVAAAFLLDRIGRRYTLSGGFFVASVGLIVSLVLVELADDNPDLLTVSVVFAFVGKFGISGAFATIYNMTSELYPTVTRSNGVAMGSVAGRIGGFLAPFIISVQNQVRWLPSAIFGVLGLMAAFTTLTFPETNGCRMMETIEEAEYFYAHKKPRAIKADLELNNLKDGETAEAGETNEAFDGGVKL